MHHFCRYFTMAWHGFLFLLSFQAFIDSRKLQNRTAKTLWKGRSFWFVCNKEILSKASKAASTQSAKWFCVHACLQLQVFEVFSATLPHHDELFVQYVCQRAVLEFASLCNQQQIKTAVLSMESHVKVDLSLT